MKKILYSGNDASGRNQSGFIDAGSNRDALDSLHQQGLNDVQLHDDAALAIPRDDLDRLSPKQQAALAKFELQLRQHPSTLTFIRGILWQSRWLITLGVGLIGWGLYSDTLWLWLCGIPIATALPAYALLNYRTAQRYDALLRASALGENQQVRELVEQLKPQFTQPEMAFDLAIRNACALRDSEPLATALESLTPWRHAIEESSPGMFEGQTALVFHAYRKYDGFLQQMRLAYRHSNESPTIAVDLALTEARFGDLERAEELLASIMKEQLPPHGQPFIHWTRGLIAKRRGEPEARQHLRTALTGLTAIGESPAVWPALALCAGYYLSVLDPERDKEEAELLMGMFGEILMGGGDGLLHTELCTKVHVLHQRHRIINS
ncbi:hypothetical protein [Motiliproteus sediminis]|uniref:hypothetical protein n=1 Tax=Motiliproteus sediminis TaxID=1468178 RepID=UPI001AEF8B93|nr:hypothetical protein [Motiliproteus sediminis]